MAKVLVDLDGTVFNWGKEYDRTLDRIDTTTSMCTCDIERSEEQTSFNLHLEHYSDAENVAVKLAMDKMDYGKLEPYDGAVEAIKLLASQGHEILFVTSPWLSNLTCISGKYASVEKYFGPEWVEKVIITKDKTCVSGDILIDDKPDITGSCTPTWKQVLFDQPYNQKSLESRFYVWDGFLDVLNQYQDDLALDEMPDDAPIADEDLRKIGVNPELVSYSEWAASKGEVRTTSSTGGEKGVKPQRYDLIPVYPMDLLAELYGNGAAKYSSHNWRKGYSWSNSYAAAMRHMTSFWNGEDFDPEMGLPHVTSAAFHMFALAQFMRDFPEFDDRYKKEDS